MAFLLRKSDPPLAKRVYDRVKPTAIAAGAGAAAAYLLDPDRGKGRRAKLRDTAIGRARGTARQAGRVGRKIGSDAYGMVQRVTHRTPADPNPDDATLAQKIRSEMLGWGGEYSTTTVLVNAENGRVVLRGQVDHPDQVDELEREVRRVPGVVDVENLVHIKGSPPTNKTEALEASRGGVGPRIGSER